MERLGMSRSLKRDKSIPTVSEFISVTERREETLQAQFDESVTRILGVPPEPYFDRLNIENLLELKVVTSTIHAIITLKLTFALVEWLGARLPLTPNQTQQLRSMADAARPFESGFDLDSEKLRLIAEIKGNIPVKGGSKFGAAQLKGLSNDVLQMFGLPPKGKLVGDLSQASKIHLAHRKNSRKFLGIYDSPLVREATRRWMTSFQRSHPNLRIEIADQVTAFNSDTVYVVFLGLAELSGKQTQTASEAVYEKD